MRPSANGPEHERVVCVGAVCDADGACGGHTAAVVLFPRAGNVDLREAKVDTITICVALASTLEPLSRTRARCAPRAADFAASSPTLAPFDLPFGRVAHAGDVRGQLVLGSLRETPEAKPPRAACNWELENGVKEVTKSARGRGA